MKNAADVIAYAKAHGFDFDSIFFDDNEAMKYSSELADLGINEAFAYDTLVAHANDEPLPEWNEKKYQIKEAVFKLMDTHDKKNGWMAENPLEDEVVKYVFSYHNGYFEPSEIREVIQEEFSFYTNVPGDGHEHFYVVIDQGDAENGPICSGHCKLCGHTTKKWFGA